MDIVLPSKPRIISETEEKGVYEIDGLYPGYGHTLGNSLRRILLSSLPGAAITTVKIEGVDHEFSTIHGVKEDVINILLNLKGIRLKIHADGPQMLTLKVNGQKKITAKDIKTPSQVEIINKDWPIATLIAKDGKLNVELTAERGIGYVPREVGVKDKVEVGILAIDAIFTPVRRASYDVENMRIGGRTDFNRLRISIQTDGTISPREALERSVDIMIKQLHAISGFEEEVSAEKEKEAVLGETAEKATAPEKIKIDDINLSSRIISALRDVGIKTVGGLTKKKEEALLAMPGLGNKAIEEIKEALTNLGLKLKE
ncbi:MAG: DNA-directed RNA polymerase subunit alpha [Candidatus Niyogibacteria bacterium]|nr:DNA-directed RNA polymerase subunit alpha [Candidatus Niyogibacteria bacterium]